MRINSALALFTRDTSLASNALARTQTRKFSTQFPAALYLHSPVTSALPITISVGNNPPPPSKTNISFGDNAVLSINARNAVDSIPYVAMGAEEANADKLKLDIVNASQAQIIMVFKDGATTNYNSGKWITFDNALLSAILLEDGRVLVLQNSKSVTDALPKVGYKSAGLAESASQSHQIGTADKFVDSSIGGVRFLSRAIARDYVYGGKDAVKAIESISRLSTIAAVPQMAMGANIAGVNAVNQRTTIAMPTDAMQSVHKDTGTGINAGDDIPGLSDVNGYEKNGFAMWVMPMWQSNKSFGMNAGNFKVDTRARIGGVAIGADYTIEQAIRLGLTFNIGGGHATGSGDFAETTNNMDFWGIGAYAGWTWNNFGLTADVTYTSTSNDIKQEMHPDFRMGDLKSEVRASAISTGIRGEYKIATSALDITPHVGVRYMNLTTNGYDVKSNGLKIQTSESAHQNIWTFPVGVQFAKSFDMNNGWYVKPSLDLSIIPAAGDIEAPNDIRFTGISGATSMETQTMDRVSYGGQVGLEFGNDNMKLGMNYNLQMGAHSTNHGVFGTLRYEF